VDIQVQSMSDCVAPHASQIPTRRGAAASPCTPRAVRVEASRTAPTALPPTRSPHGCSPGKRAPTAHSSSAPHNGTSQRHLITAPHCHKRRRTATRTPPGSGAPPPRSHRDHIEITPRSHTNPSPPPPPACRWVRCRWSVSLTARPSIQGRSPARPSIQGRSHGGAVHGETGVRWMRWMGWSALRRCPMMRSICVIMRRRCSCMEERRSWIEASRAYMSAWSSE